MLTEWFILTNKTFQLIKHSGNSTNLQEKEENCMSFDFYTCVLAWVSTQTCMHVCTHTIVIIIILPIN